MRPTPGALHTVLTAPRAEPDARQCMTRCRRAIGLGADTARDDSANTDQIDAAPMLLRDTYRLSRGTWDGNRRTARLAQRRLQALGLESPPVPAETRTKRMVTYLACLVVDGAPIPDDWADGAALWARAAADVNAGRWIDIPLGADGAFSAAIRVIDASEPMLRAKDNRTLAATTPVFRLDRPQDGVFLRPGKALSRDVRQDWYPGRYAAMLARFQRRGSDRYMLLSPTRLDAIQNQEHTQALDAE